MGRRKLPIEFIKNDKSRRETFKKRLKGLKGKAEQLATLCNAEVGVIVICDGKVQEAGFSGTASPSAGSGSAAVDFKTIISKYAMYFYHAYHTMALQRILHPDLGNNPAQVANGGGGGGGGQLLDLNMPGGSLYPPCKVPIGMAMGMSGGGGGSMETMAGFNHFGMPTTMFPLPLDHKLPVTNTEHDHHAADDSTSDSSKSSIATTTGAQEPHNLMDSKPENHRSRSPNFEIDQLGSHYPAFHPDFNVNCGFPGGGSYQEMTPNSTAPNFDHSFVNAMITSSAAGGAATTTTTAGNSGGDGSSRGAAINSLFFDGAFHFNTLDDMDFDKHWADDPVNPAAASNQSSNTTTIATATATPE
ncbi:type I MADS-domain transcription factor [Selaginella moellendorffii]|uniref:Type I MADS-domain transcription factor n=1 Tax=Selaginella moellendorffii TaxID=88036 RepID=D8RJA6_SELML|nr:type I MADS-domain transcription factor [Selaginella moellendorffii]